jgi:hypothetical protein
MITERRVSILYANIEIMKGALASIKSEILMCAERMAAQEPTTEPQEQAQSPWNEHSKAPVAAMVSRESNLI